MSARGWGGRQSEPGRVGAGLAVWQGTEPSTPPQVPWTAGTAGALGLAERFQVWHRCGGIWGLLGVSPPGSVRSKGGVSSFGPLVFSHTDSWGPTGKHEGVYRAPGHSKLPGSIVRCQPAPGGLQRRGLPSHLKGKCAEADL